MVQQHKLAKKEKELLNVLGRHPDSSMKELVNNTRYKWVSTVEKKIEQFRNQNMLMGPICNVELSKLCKNTIHRLFCILELNHDYESVTTYLTLIKPLVWVYPVLSPHKKLLLVSFFSSDTTKLKSLLQLLKDNDIIADFIVRVHCCRRINELPDFFGDPLPPLDNLLDTCELPDVSFGCYDTTWTECDIKVLSYLQGGYEETTFLEILRKERKLHNRNWTYEQIKGSYEKMINHGLIKKQYYIHPYPLDQCADFFLFIKTEDIHLTRKILHNFARGGRIYREYVMCDEWGTIGCISHPLFPVNLMHELDKIDEIKKKELYRVRSVIPGICYVGQHSEFDYYDVETQILQYPYDVYREQIKEALERELEM